MVGSYQRTCVNCRKHNNMRVTRTLYKCRKLKHIIIFRYYSRNQKLGVTRTESRNFRIYPIYRDFPISSFVRDIQEPCIVPTGQEILNIRPRKFYRTANLKSWRPKVRLARLPPL